MLWSCIQSDFNELGSRNKYNVEKQEQKIENQKWNIEKQKLEGRKMVDQDNFSCQSSKLKIRNVANNYENTFYT